MATKHGGHLGHLPKGKFKGPPKGFHFQHRPDSSSTAADSDFAIMDRRQNQHRLYVINRSGSGEAQYVLLSSNRAEIASYGVKLDTWRVIKNVSDFGVAVVDNVLYVIGGYDKINCRQLHRVVKYDPFETSWIQCAPLLKARSKFGVCVLDGKIYVCGGERSDGHCSCSCEVFDPRQDQWSEAGVLVAPRKNHCCTNFGDDLFCAGGDFGTQSHNNFWIYEKDRWEELDHECPLSMPRCIDRYAICPVGQKIYFIGGSKIYVFGGCHLETGHDVRVCECFDTIKGTWEDEFHFRKGRTRSLILRLTTAVLLAWTEVAPARGEVGLDNPCGILTANGTTAFNDIYVIIRDLRTKSFGLKLLSEEIILFIEDAFPTFFTSDQLSSLEDVHFVEPISPNRTAEEAQNATVDAVSAFLSHWSLLYKLLTHLDYICYHGEIGAANNDGSSLGILRHLLKDLKLRTYSLVCDLKIGLNSLDTETSTPAYKPSDLFFFYGQTLMTEIHRAFIVTRESDMIMNHLNIVYKEMENAYE